MLRTFVAIHPPGPARDALEALALRLDEGRAMRPENLHLTLAFLGEAPTGAVEDVAHELAAIEAEAPDIAFEGVGVFGGRTPRSAHARVRPDPALAALAKEVRRAARRGGMELPAERFTPHVTVARFGPHDPAGEGLARWLAREAGFRGEPFRAEAFGLWRSELRAGGPLHTEMMRVPLL